MSPGADGSPSGTIGAEDQEVAVEDAGVLTPTLSVRGSRPRKPWRRSMRPLAPEAARSAGRCGRRARSASGARRSRSRRSGPALPVHEPANAKLRPAAAGCPSNGSKLHFRRPARGVEREHAQLRRRCVEDAVGDDRLALHLGAGEAPGRWIRTLVPGPGCSRPGSCRRAPRRSGARSRGRARCPSPWSCSAARRSARRPRRPGPSSSIRISSASASRSVSSRSVPPFSPIASSALLITFSSTRLIWSASASTSGSVRGELGLHLHALGRRPGVGREHVQHQRVRVEPLGTHRRQPREA